jgi:Tfp pilus assembly protein PilV
MNTLKQRGIGLIEVIIGAAIISVGVIALIQGYNIYLNYALANSGNVQAAYLLEEGMEGLTFIRDKAWTPNILPLSTTTTYYLAFDATASTWKATTTVQYVDGVFLRTIGITDVARDTNGYVVTSGGTYDSNTKKIQVTLQYHQGHATTTRTMTSYIANVNAD